MGSKRRVTVSECLRLGRCFYSQGSYSLAIEQFTLAAKRAPHAPNIWSNLGAAYINAGDLAKARNALDRAFQLSPDYATAYFHLAQLCEKTGEPEKAKGYYKRVVELTPNSEIGRRAREEVEDRRPKIIWAGTEGQSD